MPYFCYFAILISCTALLAEEFPLEQKSSKARTATNAAVREIHKNTPQSTSKAIEVLQEITIDPSFRRLDNDRKMETYFALSAAYQKAGQYKEQDALFEQLLQDSSYSRFWIELNVQRARSWLQQSRVIDAGKILNQLLRKPKRRVSHHEAEEIRTLALAFQRYFEEELIQGEKLFSEKRYKEASSHYQILHQAFLQKLFPQSRSIQSCQEFIAPLRYRLACCLYLTKDYQGAVEILAQQNQQFLESHKTLHTLYLQSVRLQAIASTKAGLYKDAARALEYYLKDRPNNEALRAECQYLNCLALFYQPDFLQACRTLSTTFPAKREACIYLQGLKKWHQREYSEAYALFSELFSTTPQFEKAAELCFFAARCEELQNKDATALYQSVFLNHPDAWCAAESYFRYFPESDYIQGNAKAILHLKRMPKEWDNSPFAIMAAFYVAENLLQESPQKNLGEAHIKQLHESEHLFHSLIAKIKELPKDVQIKFERMLLWAELDVRRVQCLLASHGGTNLTAIAKAAESLQNFKLELEARIKNPAGVRISTLYTLWQESSWQRYRALKLQGDTLGGREELESLLEYSTRWDYLKSEAVCFAFCERAALHIRNKEFQAAATILSHAEALHANATGEKRELLLRIWLQQSELKQKERDIDAAMSYLSRIINDMTVSSLRVQAMYVRAELYELKGRRDLAMRQLEACSKKGGEWAGEAKKKLEVMYGYE